MMRVRVARHCRGPVTTQRSFYCGGFAATLPRQQQYFNPYTWPRTWKATDIQTHLQGNLKNADETLEKAGQMPTYESLETMLMERNIPGIWYAIHKHIKPPPQTTIDTNAAPDRPDTWPENWNTTDIENLLSKHLMKPRVGPRKVPNYALLAAQLAERKLEALEDELWHLIEHPVARRLDMYNWPRKWNATDIENHVRHQLKLNATPDFKLLQALLRKNSIVALACKLQDDLVIVLDSASGGKYTTTPKFFDPSTWPKTWSATNIQNLLLRHIKPNALPNYATLEKMLWAGDIGALERELHPYLDSLSLAKYNDPYTWPRFWNAKEIETLLRDHLQRGASPSYESLEAMLKAGDIHALKRDLQAYIRQRDTTAKYFNPYTWPKDSSSGDIEDLLCEHLKPDVTPDYKALEAMLAKDDIEGVALAIRDYIKPPKVTRPNDPNAALHIHYDPCTWPKDWNTTDIENLLHDHLKNPSEVPNYARLVTLLGKGDLEALEKEVVSRVKPLLPTELSFRADVQKEFDAFNAEFPGHTFPQTTDEMKPIVDTLHEVYYPGKVVPSFFDALWHVFTRSDTYEDATWYDRRLEFLDLVKMKVVALKDSVMNMLNLTRLKMRYEKLICSLVVLTDITGEIRSFLLREVLWQAKESATSIAAVASILLQENRLEAQQNVDYMKTIENAALPQLDGTQKTKPKPKQDRPPSKKLKNEDSVVCGGYRLCVPKELEFEASDVQYLITDSSAHPKLPPSKAPPKLRIQDLPEHRMRYKACRANVETFINTSEYFSDLNDRLEKLLKSTNSEKVLYMMGWMFSWDMRLVPSKKESTLRYHITALKEKGVVIRILYWQLWSSTASLSERAERVFPLFDPAKTHCSETAAALKAMKLEKGVEYIAHHVNDAKGIVSRRMYSHHQKHVTILDGDDLIAYCGGSDIAVGRYDDENKVIFRRELTNTVLFNTSLEYGGTKNDGEKIESWDFDVDEAPRLAWQDVQFRVDGASAHNIARIFEHFFDKASGKNPSAIVSALCKIKNLISTQKKSKAGRITNLNAPSKGKSKTIVQIVNSRNRKLPFQLAMLQLIGKAKKSIYIEQQFFQGRLDFEDTPRNVLRNHVPLAIVARILEVNDPKFKVRIVLPLIPDSFLKLEGIKTGHTLHLHHETKQSMISLINKLRPELVQCLEFCYLVRELGGKSYPIYVHSKVMIVDDAACIIGSANINDRSMMHFRDTEMAALIISKNVASNLRKRLEKQHAPFLKPFPLDPKDYPCGYYGKKKDGKLDLSGRKSMAFTLFPLLLG